MDVKLEVVMIPVADIDRAKKFYTEQMGFNLDVDHEAGPEFRVVQVTPPGSAASVVFGRGITDGTLNPTRGTHLVVPDLEAYRAELTGRGVEVSDIRHMTPEGWKPGADPAHTDYNTFADLKDPDGNVFVLQERGHSKQ
jgi:catechol 2,3-dioxygenase-like lactoylglutathione lyase family enzyme